MDWRLLPGLVFAKRNIPPTTYSYLPNWTTTNQAQQNQQKSPYLKNMSTKFVSKTLQPKLSPPASPQPNKYDLPSTSFVGFVVWNIHGFRMRIFSADLIRSSRRSRAPWLPVWPVTDLSCEFVAIWGSWKLQGKDEAKNHEDDVELYIALHLVYYTYRLVGI